MNSSRHGGRILADQLAIQGCDTVYCLPGESFLAALDGLHDHQEIKTIVCRQEGGAAIMAEAYGKLTNKPGICFVTRGPGATNASAGVHIAMQDSTPMILFIGQVAARMMDREAFQEIDYRRMFAQLCKWVAQIDDAERIPEYVSRAYHVATSGRPGPVVLALPENMLASFAEVDDAKPATRLLNCVSESSLAKVSALLKNAQRPLMIAGGGGWTSVAAAAAAKASEIYALSVMTDFRCQDYVDNRHPHYAGFFGLGTNPGILSRINDADLVLMVGARMGEIPSNGYQLINIPNPTQTLIHIHAEPKELGMVYRPDLSICANSETFLSALAQTIPSAMPTRDDWINSGHTAYLDSLKPIHLTGHLQLSEVIHWITENMPDDTFVTNGAGNYTAFVSRYIQFKHYRTQLAPHSGSMGYALPAAIAAAMHYPARNVVCVTGDGDFMMTCQELATAVQNNLSMIIVIVNNSMLGTIRVHQERKFPKRIQATQLQNPDFAAMANSYGANGVTATTTQQVIEAISSHKQGSGITLIDAQVDPNSVTPTATLEQIRSDGVKAQLLRLSK